MSKTILELLEIGIHAAWDIALLAVLIRYGFVEKKPRWSIPLLIGVAVTGIPLAIVSTLLILERIG